jgi:hypothetical protein
MSKYFIATITLLFSIAAKAQDSSALDLIPALDTIPVDKIAVGVGGGYEFGGIGANAIYFPTRGVGVFFGAGYALSGFGYNAGVKLRIVADQSAYRFMPFLIGMYGYNATVFIPNYNQWSKVFYGATVGAGVDFRPGNSKFGYITATVYFPFRSTAIKDYINYLNEFRGVTYSTSRIFPLSVSIGYKFIFSRFKNTPPKEEPLQ